MKVLHLLQSNRFSGAENVVCQIIKMFEQNKDYEMIYVSPCGPITSILDQMNIPHYGMNKFGVKDLQKALNELKPDIIHAHDISASVLATIVGIGKKYKIISHVHVNNSNMSKLNWKSVVYGLSALCYSNIFWVSSSCYENYVLKKFLENKSQVLLNVMDKQTIFNKKNLDVNVYNYDIAYVGRITNQKDPIRLLSVLKQIVNKIPNVKIAIVGTGELEEYIHKIAESQQLEHNIDFKGFMSNPLRVLEGSKVLIMTSKYEGLPMTVLEALALGVPVVSTPVDGLKEVIINNVNGYLEETDDGLVEKLYSIIIDKSKRERLSIGARARFDEMNDIERYRKTLRNAYEEERWKT